MIKYFVLTAILTLTTIGYSAEEAVTTFHSTSTHLSNVNIYTNAPVKSFIVDFYEKDFKSVSVTVSNLSGNVVAEYELGNVTSGTFAELNIPTAVSVRNMIITVSSEGKSLVEKTGILY
ncbi:MAG: hypothetical protein ACJA0Q_000638 [Saprospiraceae bacterium]|jgi:hypothetical protein